MHILYTHYVNIVNVFVYILESNKLITLKKVSITVREKFRNVAAVRGTTN